MLSLMFDGYNLLVYFENPANTFSSGVYTLPTTVLGSVNFMQVQVTENPFN